MNVTTITNSTLSEAVRLPPQAKKILRHLEKGKTISLIEALHVYQISGLAFCIHKIRNAGYDVITSMKETETGKQYARYSLHAPLSFG